MSGVVHRATVRAGGQTVLAFHATRFPRWSEAEWRRHVEAGRVTCNGREVSPDHVLSAGDRLELHRPEWIEPDAPMHHDVVFEDADLLVVDKPAGLQVMPGGPFHRRTLLWAVRGEDPLRADWSPVHRIGRGTSGLVVFGKTSEARASLCGQFRDRRVGKLYLGVVEDPGLPISLACRQPIDRLPRERALAHGVVEGGRPALTRVRVLARRGGRALVAATPVTGRPDQIRIHLAAAGAPLAGDPLYLPGADVRAGVRPGECGYVLHAAALRLRHPRTGRSLRLRSGGAPLLDDHLE